MSIGLRHGTVSRQRLRVRRLSTVEHHRLAPSPVLAVDLDGGERIGDAPRADPGFDEDDGTFVVEEMIVDIGSGDDRDESIAAAGEPSPESHLDVDLLAGCE